MNEKQLNRVSTFLGEDHAGSIFLKYFWKAFWIKPVEAYADKPVVFAASLQFDLSKDQTVRIHVSADQSFELFLDGRLISTGPETSDLSHWMFSTLEIDFPKGEHCLSARVWYAASKAATACISFQPGFLLATDDSLAETLNTGTAPWKVKPLEGYFFEQAAMASYVPPMLVTDTSKIDQLWKTGEGSGWQDPVLICQAINNSHPETTSGWVMFPAMLPEQKKENIPFGTTVFATYKSASAESFHTNPLLHDPVTALNSDLFLNGRKSLELPANKTIHLLIDLKNYCCAFPELSVSKGKGSRLSIEWTEALLNVDPSEVHWSERTKGNRNDFINAWFLGFGDTWILDGRAHTLESPYWHAGRYVLIRVITLDEPLILESARLTSTGFPMIQESSFDCSDKELSSLSTMLWHSMSSCAHETYMDCPFYERLMYAGDTRLEILTTYVGTFDSSLPEKAIKLFNWSRNSEGLTASRYPSTSRQTIAPFSLWWIGMLSDFLFWRNNIPMVKRMLPGMRNVLFAFEENIREDGLLNEMEGWNFCDWVPGWTEGVAPHDPGLSSGLIHWQLITALGYAIQLENCVGEPELASLWTRLRQNLFTAVEKFWDPVRKIYSEDSGHGIFSEHSQSLALLSGLLDDQRRSAVLENLLSATDLARTTIYYSHYLFEALAYMGRTEEIIKRLVFWKQLPAQGFTTTPEKPEPSRSDCHGWGSHPYYHFFASILGIRPAAPGFTTIEIKPQLGTLTSASGSMVHPAGLVKTQFTMEKGIICGRVSIPDGIKGILTLPGRKIPFVGAIDF